MMELMEPTTSILEPHSIVLRDKGKWKDSLGIKDFLTATHRRSLRELKKVNFYSISTLRLPRLANSTTFCLASRLKYI